MTEETNTGRGCTGLRWVMLCMCVVIFTWGLQGKLALYHASTPAHPRIVAKLIQDGKVNKNVRAEDSARKDWLGQIHYSITLIFCRPILAVRRNRQVHRVVLASIPAAFRELFFRPPPVIV